jgi:hypothetical protein
VADIIRGIVTLGAPGGGTVPVELNIDIQFTQREVSEKLKYGVHAQLVRHDDNIYMIVRNAGMTSMSLQQIPQSPRVTVVRGYAHTIIEPVDISPRRVKFNFSVDQAELPAGTEIKAIMTVVPEIAPVENASNIVKVPR